MAMNELATCPEPIALEKNNDPDPASSNMSVETSTTISIQSASTISRTHPPPPAAAFLAGTPPLEENPPPPAPESISESISESLSTHPDDGEDDKKDANSNNATLFANWDKSWSSLLNEPDLGYSRACFAAFSSVFTHVPSTLTKTSGLVVPLDVANLLWSDVLSSLECTSVQESLQKVLTVLTEQLGYIRCGKVTLPSLSQVDCVGFSHEIYREYSKFIAVEDEVTRNEHEMRRRITSQDLKNVPDTITPLYYYAMITIGHFVTPSEARSYLLNPKFAKSRLDVLGIVYGTEVHVLDVEHFLEGKNILQAYECIASHCHTLLPTIALEKGMQIARSFDCMGHSLSRQQISPQKYFHEALAVYEDLLDDAAIESSPMKDVIRLDMAETLQSLGNCIAFEGRTVSESDASALNHRAYLKSCDRSIASNRQMNHKAMKYYDRAFQVRRILLGNHHPLLANTLHCIGVLYFEAKLYSYAVSCFLEALRIRRLAAEEESNSDPDVELSIADTLEWIGHSHRELKKSHSCITALNEALVIRSMHRGKEHEDVASLYHSIGVVYDDLREFETSLLKYGEALRIRRHILMHCDKVDQLFLREGILETLCALGNVYSELENTSYALDCFREAMLLKSALIHESVPQLMNWRAEKDEARILPLPMFVYSSLHRVNIDASSSGITTLSSVDNDHEATDEVLNDSTVKSELLILLNIMAHVVELTLAKHGNDHLFVASVFFSMADVYMKTSNFNKASKCLEEVLRIRALNIMEKEDRKTVQAKYLLAMCSSRLGRFHRAIHLYQSALDHLESDRQMVQLCLENDCAIGEEEEKREKRGSFCQIELKDEKEGSIADMASVVSTESSLAPMTFIEKVAFLADVYYNLGNVLCAFGNEKEAVGNLEMAVKLRDNLPTTASNEISLANARYCLAVSWILSDGKFMAAREIFESTVIPTYNNHLNDHINHAHSLYYLGQIYQELSVSNIDENSAEYLRRAMECYRNALDLYRRYYSKDHVVIAHVIHSMGTIYDFNNEFSKALLYFKDTLRVYYLYNKGEHLGVAIVLSHIGIACASIEENRAALKYLLQSYSIRKKILGDSHVSVADTLHNIAGVYAKLGKFDEAMECYNASLELRINYYGENHLLVARTLNNKGIVHSRLGQYHAAMAQFKAALVIRKFHLQGDDEDMANIMYNIGNVYARTEQHEMAVECYQESLRIKRKLFGDTHIVIANTLHSMGVLYENKQEFSMAQKCYDEALQVKRLRLGDDNLSVATTLAKVGNVKALSGDFHDALNCYQKALIVQKSHYGQSHVEVAQTLVKIGSVWINAGRYTSAMNSFEEALRIRTKKLGEDHEDVASTLFMIGKVHDVKGECEDALLYYGNAFRIYNRHGGRRVDKERKKVANSLRRVITVSRGQLGCWDTFVVTGNCMLTIERMIYDFVELWQIYVLEPSRTMVRSTVANTMKNIQSVGQKALISQKDMDRYQRAMIDFGGLVDE